jgi:hypothetical protein
MTHRDTIMKSLHLLAAAAAIVATPAVAFAADTASAGTSTAATTVAAPAAQTAQTAPTAAVASSKPARAKHAARIPGTFAINTDEELRQAMLPAGPRVLSGDGGG